MIFATQFGEESGGRIDMEDRTETTRGGTNGEERKQRKAGQEER